MTLTKMYKVKIAGRVAEDDDLEIDMGCIPLTVLPRELPIPACPDCGCLEIVESEESEIPGARRCTVCGSVFHVGFADRGTSAERRVVMTRRRYYV
jgi:hypothetical protein